MDNCMDIQHKINYFWNLGKGAKTRAEYIPVELKEPYNISMTKKNAAKRAITWLLAKAPHSVEEIADHFNLSPQLVSCLLKELSEDKCVIRESVRSRRYKINERLKKAGGAS